MRPGAANASNSISLAEVDHAAVQLSEAKMLKDVALGQRDLWRQATESGPKENLCVSMRCRRAGVITEIGTQPGSLVEAGQLLGAHCRFPTGVAAPGVPAG